MYMNNMYTTTAQKNTKQRIKPDGTEQQHLQPFPCAVRDGPSVRSRGKRPAPLQDRTGRDRAGQDETAQGRTGRPHEEIEDQCQQAENSLHNGSMIQSLDSRHQGTGKVRAG